MPPPPAAPFGMIVPSAHGTNASGPRSPTVYAIPATTGPPDARPGRPPGPGVVRVRFCVGLDNAPPIELRKLSAVLAAPMIPLIVLMIDSSGARIAPTPFE